jgi:phosphoribosylaminoimidazole-succinocarboxamide synthase
MNIDNLETHDFNQLPLVTEGESKEVRYCGNGEVVIRPKPTIYSYTHNRSGEITGSDTLRLKAIRALLPVLRAAGITHTYQAVNDWWILSCLVLQPSVQGDAIPFTPSDLNPGEIAALPRANPIEVVAKAVHSGTPKHRYYRFSDYQTRDGANIAAETSYPEPIVRFDWRNPLHGADGTRLADEVLPEAMAEWFIHTAQAKQTALTAFGALRQHLSSKGLDLWDICFFIAEDGQTMFGEVSPDCLRVRAADGSALDKDAWRAGGSSETVLTKWQTFVELLEQG